MTKFSLSNQKRNVRGLSVLPAGVLLLVPAATPARQAGGRVELKMHYVVGATSQYHTSAQTVVSMPVPNQPTPMQTTLDVDLVQQMHVNRVSAKGESEIAAATVSGTILMNGKPFATPDSKPFTLNYDAHGNITAIKGLSPQAAFGGLLGSGSLGMQSAYLPANPVRQGDIWSQTMRLPGMPVGGTGKIVCTWLAMERVGKYQTARIRTLLTQPLKIMLTGDGQPTQEPGRAVNVFTGDMTMTFISNFAVAEGKVIRSSGNGGVLLTQKLKATPKPNSTKKPTAETNKISMKMRVGYNLIE